jgi:hypothetical protein
LYQPVNTPTVRFIVAGSGLAESVAVASGRSRQSSLRPFTAVADVIANELGEISGKVVSLFFVPGNTETQAIHAL